MCREAWEAKGIPVRQLGGVQAAVRFVEQLARLDNMSGDAARREYAALGLPNGARELSTREEVLERLRCVALWRELPIKELHKECREMGVLSGGLASERRPS
eukprot:CAMPEP_0170342546 /NCGR_PEP_ID=MMETSP0116_2-20130129/72433_1 /TAXON_ID=400756 /ORGANISM="Durinskia baltica, Strain CSIRO CS-38" /LENGTH=101 /DNA_ID=CAMNT_0010596169 /DNA_START=17 /DNA_END=319 /DNA_ORIENTATION=-